MAVNDELGASWRSEILQGLSVLPHSGAVPGTIEVWGQCTRAILSTDEKNKPVIIAAAELGEGRIVALAHNCFVNDSQFSSLKENLCRWLTRGNPDASRLILDHKSRMNSIPPKALLMWHGSKSTGDVTDETILKHVGKGGSLLHAMCPWGWLQLNPGKCLRDMPLNGILENAGLCYTECYASIPSCGLDVNKCMGSEQNHILMNLRYLKENVEQLIDSTDDDMPAVDLTWVPQHVCEVSLKPELQQLLDKLCCPTGNRKASTDSLMKKITPHPKQPIKLSCRKTLMSIMEKLAAINLNLKVPGVENFPGDFSSPPFVICGSAEVKSDLLDIHPTGYYLPAGSTLGVHVLNCKFPQGWKIRIGAHSDDLSNQDELRRWPRLVVTETLTAQDTNVFSSFGGLVYLESPEGKSRIHVRLDNVVEAPIFHLSDPQSAAQWKERCKAPGLWADIIGDTLIITLPSESVRDVDDPTAVMQTWDRVVRAHHDLRGTDPSKHRRQWVVTDEQPSCGYMHSGYPIVTHLDVGTPDDKLFLLKNEALIKKGNWGMYHEIGHNMQRDNWTFEGTGEVTCNIFTLHAMDVVSRQSIWIHEWLSNQLKNTSKYLLSPNHGFSEWQSDPGVALFIYAQIAQCFGWDAYKRVFRFYEENSDKLALEGLQDKIDTWFVQMSKSCKCNLGPLFDFWKIPVCQPAKDCLLGLVAFLPDDEITQMNKHHVETILKSYPHCCRVASSI